MEQAAEGTLFLDEVGDLSAEAQAKLLRFLEDGEFYRVGGTQKLVVKTRVVAATNKDLLEMSESNVFRKDLYHRLAVIRIEVPSLMERREDILPIAKHYLLEFSEKFGKNFTSISEDAEMMLKNHYWTGNVRELKNIIEKAVLLADGPDLGSEHLGLNNICREDGIAELGGGLRLPVVSPEGIDLPAALNAIEKHYFDSALGLTNNNESKAAKMLSMSRDTFRYRRKKLDNGK